MENNIAASFKIFADGPAHLKAIANEVSQLAPIQFAKEEEIGFGIKILRLTLLLSDSEGGTEALEEKIRAIPHVSELEVEQVTRI